MDTKNYDNNISTGTCVGVGATSSSGSDSGSSVNSMVGLKNEIYKYFIQCC
jgi:hypothetical protein